MPHISPLSVNKKTLEKIYSFLFSAITSRNISQKQHRLAFNELLTHTEKIMLSKRLTAISMLSQDVSPFKVSQALQLSPTTTLRLHAKLETGKFSNTEKLCKILKKGPLGLYLENLLKPLPPYGTSPSQLFKEK
jgi:Trp operon repressor